MANEEYEMVNMEEVIPRPIGRVKAQLVARFKLGLKDLLVFFGVVILFAIFAFTLLSNIWLKFSIGFVIPCIIGILLLVGEPNRRVYNNLYKLVIYLVSKKHYNQKEIDKLLPYSLIEDKYAKLKSGGYVSVIKIMGNNITNSKEGQQDHNLLQYANFFVGIHSSIYITKLGIAFDTEAQQKATLQKLLKAEELKDKIRVPLLEHNLGVASVVGREDNDVSNYYLVIKGKNKKALEEDMITIINQLQQASLISERLVGKKFVRYILKSIFPNVSTKKLLAKIDFEEQQYLYKLVDINSVTQRRSYLQHDKGFMKIIAIDQFPIRSSIAWLGDIYNIPNTSVIHRIKGMSQVEANHLLDKAHQEMRMRAYGTNVTKLSETSNQAIYMGAMEELAEKVQGTGERLLDTQLYIVVYGKTLLEMKQAEKVVLSEIGKNKMKADKLIFKQLEAWLSLSPNGDINNFYNRNNLEIGSSALSHSWPFISESFNDKGGTYLGSSNSNKPVFLDWGYRNSKENRNQSNSIVFGATGKGKSTFVKKTLKDEFANGVKCYVIDPENEYEQLAKNLGGEYLDLSGKPNTKGIIQRLNPLQPFASNEERDPMASHFKFLEAFFQALLYPSVEDVVLHMGYLKFAIADLYKVKKVKPNDEAKKWPIITDLYKHLIKLSKAKLKKDSQFRKQDIFTELSERLYDLTSQGSDGNLWDGITTLDVAKNNFVVFNIQELYSTGNKRLINSQMFLMLNYLTYLVERNKRENDMKNIKVNVSITIDEAHLLVNKDNPTTLNFAYNMYKRIRKYYGWVRFVTQNIADFTGSEDVKRETSAILNSAQFMFIFGLNPKDITDLDDLLRESGGLTNYEKAFLNIGETHSAIFLSGSQYRSTINFDYTDEEKDVWGWKESL